MNVFKKLKTFGSPTCLKWPVSYFMYFTLHYLLRKGLLGTAQLPLWPDILNSGLGALESMRLIVYWMLYHLKIEENLKVYYKGLLFSGPVRVSPIAPEYFSLFLSINKAIPLHQSSRALVSANDWLEMQMPDSPQTPTPDLTNQKLWDEVPLSVS